MAFRGSFEFTLDAKNRLTIPVKFRGPFAEGVTLARMRDVSDCISIWCTPVFDAYVAGLIESCHPLSEERETLVPLLRRERRRRRARRRRASDRPGADALDRRDREGRRRQGVTNRLEVWARERWSAVNDQLTAAVKEIRPALGNTA